jgi:hypothetical protein
MQNMVHFVSGTLRHVEEPAVRVHYIVNAYRIESNRSFIALHVGHCGYPRPECRNGNRQTILFTQFPIGVRD